MNKSYYYCIQNEKVLEEIVFIIKIHERLAFAVGTDFYPCLGKIYIDLIKIYVVYAEIVSNEVQVSGKGVLNLTIIKKMRSVKREIIKLIQTFIEKSNPQNIEMSSLIAQNFIPPLNDVLQNYVNSVPYSRFILSFS